MKEQPQTWHYGLAAKWWAEFNWSGPEIDYYRRFIEEVASPPSTSDAAQDVSSCHGSVLAWTSMGVMSHPT